MLHLRKERTEFDTVKSRNKLEELKKQLAMVDAELQQLKFGKTQMLVQLQNVRGLINEAEKKLADLRGIVSEEKLAPLRDALGEAVGALNIAPLD